MTKYAWSLYDQLSNILPFLWWPRGAIVKFKNKNEKKKSIIKPKIKERQKQKQI